MKKRTVVTDTARKLFTVSDAAIRSGGDFIPCGNGDSDILSISIDSRSVKSGDLFIALKGENSDGHNFVSMAFARGASAAMVTKEYYRSHIEGNDRETDFTSACLIIVDNTLLAFHALAASWVAEFNSLIRIGVTGSSGKTTTKEMIASILSCDGKTIANEGNLNSETGLPLSVLKIDESHKYGVFEMGINHPGEMKALAAILLPDYAIITNIGTAHIGLMGDQAAIAKEKADVFSFFNESNTAFLFDGDNWTDKIKDSCEGKVILYGPDSTACIQETVDLGLGGWEILYMGQRIYLKFVGRHNLNNAMAAISLAEVLGISPENIKAGLENVELLIGRSQIVEGYCTIIEDTYNANNESMEEIFNFITSLSWKGRVVLVLGSMKELGSSSTEVHKSVGRGAAAIDPDLIFLFGREMSDAYDSILGEGYEGVLLLTEDYSDLEKQVLGSLRGGDLVLVKGSRAMGLERLAISIQKLQEGTDV